MPVLLHFAFFHAHYLQPTPNNAKILLENFGEAKIIMVCLAAITFYDSVGNESKTI